MKLVPPGLERVFFAIVDPLIGGLVRMGVRPNTITTIGLGLVIASAVAFGMGSIRLGGFLLLLSGVVDTFDGAVARRTGTTSKFGAFYDSTLDRIGDGATFIGIGLFFMTAPDIAYRNVAVVLCMVAILTSLVVSYTRARAEGLGLECRVGIAQRAERIVGIGGAALIVGARYQGLVLSSIVAVLSLLSAITIGQRIIHIYSITEGARSREGRDDVAEALDSIAKGS
ncbi:MAG: CDP-alcohol phosphatidyltransferase family protein [Gemmatimonadetes bacterium]|nr:CDP-alcohol phosphatidyltransferase family protein [Gemmatimonadota bacterium]